MLGVKLDVGDEDEIEIVGQIQIGNVENRDSCLGESKSDID